MKMKKPVTLERFGYVGAENTLKSAISEDLQAGNFEIDESADVGTHIPYWVTSRARWEKWWWKKQNKLCRRCSGVCKQSWRVTVLRCPQFSPRTVN